MTDQKTAWLEFVRSIAEGLESFSKTPGELVSALGRHDSLAISLGRARGLPVLLGKVSELDNQITTKAGNIAALSAECDTVNECIAENKKSEREARARRQPTEDITFVRKELDARLLELGKQLTEATDQHTALTNDLGRTQADAELAKQSLTRLKDTSAWPSLPDSIRDAIAAVCMLESQVAQLRERGTAIEMAQLFTELALAEDDLLAALSA